ncbi:MAG: hypothetical protein FJY60_02740 [Betaproteobacteria bacterium]|nr:hypothetical protein [Betaproteobacteria bacterium]
MNPVPYIHLEICTLIECEANKISIISFAVLPLPYGFSIANGLVEIALPATAMIFSVFALQSWFMPSETVSPH